jgi:hypothetical protein
MIKHNYPIAFEEPSNWKQAVNYMAIFASEVDWAKTFERCSGYNRPVRMILYSAYIQSRAWKIMRQRRLSLDGGKCQVCGSELDLNIHHKTYERLGHENLDDLVTLCRHHHYQVHEDSQLVTVVTEEDEIRRLLRDQPPGWEKLYMNAHTPFEFQTEPSATP